MNNQTSSITATDACISVCSLTTNWWAFVLRGVLAVVLAALALWMPGMALLAVTLVFGAFALVNGIFSLISAVRNIRSQERWGWLAFNGVIGIVAGIAVAALPWVATIAIAVFLWVSIAVWSIFTGMIEVLAAIRLRKEIKGEFWLALSGVLSVALGGVVLWMFLTRPLESFLAAGWVLGAYWLVSGIVLTLLGIKLRKWQKTGRPTATAPQATSA